MILVARLKSGQDSLDTAKKPKMSSASNGVNMVMNWDCLAKIDKKEHVRARQSFDSYRHLSPESCVYSRHFVLRDRECPRQRCTFQMVINSLASAGDL